MENFIGLAFYWLCYAEADDSIYPRRCCYKGFTEEPRIIGRGMLYTFLGMELKHVFFITQI